MAAPVILLEATPRRAADGVVQTVRLAGGGGVVPYFYGGAHWRAGLDGQPRATAALAFDGEQLGGGGTAQALELRWGAATNAVLAELAALFWTDAPVTVRIGPEDLTGAGTLPPVVASGLVLDTAIKDGRLRIGLADGAVDLKRALLTGRFAGTGGAEGPAEWAGRIRTRGWGRLFNVPGDCIDKANNIWCFGDPARAWQAFDAVRTEGVPAAAGDLTPLAWQGSVAATFTALQAAAATAGGGVLCPSIACIKWWTQPSNLHVDARGETAGGYVETAPEIAQRIVAARSTLAFAAGAVAAAAVARPSPCGWRVDSDGATAADELSALLGGVSLSWALVDGAIVLRGWDWTASTRAARSYAVTRRQVFKPVAARRLGYRRNQAPMARGDLAGIVFLRDVIYDNGTPAATAIAAAATTAAWPNVSDPAGTRPDDSATRNEDGDNMIPSPVLLDRAQLSGGAVRSVTGATGRNADGFRIQFTPANSLAFWDSWNAIPVSPGETLFYRHFAKSDGINVDNVRAGFALFKRDGTLINYFDMPTTALLGSEPANVWTEKTAVLVVPADGAFIQPYAIRSAATAGFTFFVAEPRLGRSQSGADVTSTAESWVDGVNAIVITADSVGTPVQGSSTHRFYRMLGAVDVSATTIWSTEAVSGCTVAVGSTGIVTRSGALARVGKFTLVSVRAGVTRKLPVEFHRDDAPPAQSTGNGTGGTGGSGNVASSISAASTAYSTAGSESAFTCTAGTGGQVALTGAINVALYRSSGGDVSEDGYAKLQWRTIGGTWADVVAETPSNGPASWSQLGEMFDATITPAQTKTGLTAGTTYEFRALVRRGGTTSSVTATFSGSISGDGS